MNKNSLAIAGIMGTNFVANIIVGGAIGFALDYYLHNIFLFFLFFFLGVIAGIWTLYKDTKKLIAEEKNYEE